MTYEKGDYVLSQEPNSPWIYISEVLEVKNKEIFVRDIEKISDERIEPSDNTFWLRKEFFIGKIPKNFKLETIQESHPEIFL